MSKKLNIALDGDPKEGKEWFKLKTEKDKDEIRGWLESIEIEMVGT